MNIITKIVGIVNVTPDSFSDGGKNFAASDALHNIEAMLEQGVDMLDFGAESTRPQAEVITSQKEIERLKPIVEVLVKRGDLYNSNNKKVRLAIDSYRPETVRFCLDNGFDVINDVTGFCNQEMVNLAVEYKTQNIFMHSLSVPADKNIILPQGSDVVKTLIEYANSKKLHLLEQGIKEDNIIFDVGLGFGKNSEQSWQIVRNVTKISHETKLPLYIGHSRKSFLADIANNPANSRDVETLALSIYLMQQGIGYLRVHNVQQHNIARMCLDELANK